MNKWVHIIGVCGVTTSGIAVCFKKEGWQVTGSDKGFFSPVSDYLLAYNINVLPGFKKERLTNKAQHPDLVVFQGTKGINNEELLEAQRLRLTIKSYPEILEDYVVNKKNSIVVCGSFGKTTTTALLVNIFKKTKYSTSFMVGGLNHNLSPNIVFNNKSDFSIIEGDEYITSYQNPISKYFYYHPKYVILTGVSWDHADVFKNENEYIKNFIKFVKQIPKDGILVYNLDDNNAVKVSKEAICKKITYKLSHIPSDKTDWEIIKDSKPLPCIVRNINNNKNLEIIPYERNVIGKINDENILAAAALAYELGIKKEIIQLGIKSFYGIKRRMEIRYKTSDLIIVDDFGSTPIKVSTSLKTIHEDFPNFHNVIIFEPSSGNRVAERIKSYEKTFLNSEMVILPRFSILPPSKSIKRFTEDDLAKKLMKSGFNAKVILNDILLVKFLSELAHKKKPLIILFMGSHSFRKIIPNLIEDVKKWKK